MRIMSWNLNGIISCVQHNSFQALSPFTPDIVCCQGIRTKQQPQAFPGYYHFWNPGQRDGYSGTLTMTRESPLSIIYGLGDEDLDSEGRVLTVELPDIYIVNAYSPNSQKNLSRHHFRSRWDDAFRAFVCNLADIKPVVACGDFNVAMSDIDIYPENLRQYWALLGYASEERANLLTLCECGFTDAFRYLYPNKTGSYTWWSNRLKKRDENRGWRLDYFFVSDDIVNKINDVQHLTGILGSDHCPIMLELA